MWKHISRMIEPSPGRPPADDPAKVVIYDSEMQRLAEYTRQYPDIETGGDLFGYWTHSGAPVVGCVIGPGRHSRRSTTSFYQDEAYLQERGTELYDQHGLQHVGEWHSHHRLGLNQPSGGDLRTVQRGMQQQGWQRFLLIIATLGDSDEQPVTVNPWLFARESGAVQPLHIRVLPGVSPFHASAIDAREEPLSRTVTHLAWRPGPHTPAMQTQRKVGQAYPGAWFSKPENQDRLRRIVADFSRAGMPVRMVPENNGAALRLLVQDEQILLGSGFPEQAPVRITAEGGHDHGVPWSAGMPLFDWYQATRRAAQQPGEHLEVRE